MKVVMLEDLAAQFKIKTQVGFISNRRCMLRTQLF